jgi:LacI family transcriptional regulator
MCLESKLRVPQDVAVVGVGNIELACETSHVPITSVDIAWDEVARAGAELLDKLMTGGAVPRQPILVPPRGLVVRRSSDALALAHPAVLRAADYVAKHLAEPLDIPRLATAAGLARRTLFRVFESELRCTPAEFLHRQRMARARRLLAESEASIKEVAATCGFGTQRTMNRLFLRMEGLSPRAWKTAHLNRRSLLD